MKVALQMDALERLNLTYDSTLYLAQAAAQRGFELFHYEPTQLAMSVANGKTVITARGHSLKYKPGEKNPWVLGEEQKRDLQDFDIVLMRQDPPFDLGYITATHILEHLTGKTRVINDPVGVRNAPEKLLIALFPELMPPTLITRDRLAIEDFRKTHKDIIIKPLHGHAGHGIFHLKDDDDNLPALVETMAALNSEPWMIQKYLPINKLGDKRAVLLDGELVGLFNRFPPEGDMRGNMRVGGRAEAAEANARDKEICAAIGPALRERGLFLSGVDIIGDYLTEINVTSPTGLIVADQFAKRTGKDTIAEKFWHKLVD
ncbi:MAG: glutathione synthase [Alphaproteobacteria bacterium]